MTSYPTPTWMAVRYGAHRTARATVAAERRGGYAAGTPAGDGSATPPTGEAHRGATGGGDEQVGGDATVPFGLPVLAQVPRLAGVLNAIAGAEQRMLDAVVGVGQLLADDEVAHATGVPVEHWLAIVCRQTRMDRRLLLRLARLLDRFPALRAGVAAGRVSFAQLRGLGIVLRQAPTVIDADLDELLVRLLDELQGADPDALIDQLRRAIVELVAPVTAEECERVTNSLYLQPNLSRTGGTYGGELDAAGLAILDGATAPARDQLDHPGGTRGARADNLLARLVHQGATTGTPAADGAAHRDGDDDQADSADDAREPGEAVGRGRGGPDEAGRVEDEPGDARDDDQAGAAAAAAAGAGTDVVWPWRVQAGGLLPPVKLLVRVQLETLGALPGDLLTQLTGGHLKLSSQAARWLLDRQGVELRTVVIDQGEVVGVGRRTRQPPGWMADVVHAVHDTCTEPLCDRPARSADLDHATPWWPDRPDGPYGTTDADNIGPLCSSTNQAKEKHGWRARQTGDGRRTWTHARSGLTVTTVPATWRPTGWEPVHHHRPHDHPPGHSGGSAASGNDPPDPNGSPSGPPAVRTGASDPDRAADDAFRAPPVLPSARVAPPPDPDELPF
jgi:hypothetical protein